MGLQFSLEDLENTNIHYVDFIAACVSIKRSEFVFFCKSLEFCGVFYDTKLARPELFPFKQNFRWLVFVTN